MMTPEQRNALEHYRDLLIQWNRQMNLTAITDPTEIWAKHMLDSLTILELPDLPPQARLADVGTGAGFPGLPLKIVRPAWQVTLIDATAKKITFLEAVIEALQLENISAVQARAETAGQTPRFRESFDIATARAVARLPVLAEYMLPLCKVGGVCIAMKGGTAHEEAADAANALQLLGGEIEHIQTVHLEGVDDERYLVVIRKTDSTPYDYPRRDGVPRKNPL